MMLRRTCERIKPDQAGRGPRRAAWQDGAFFIIFYDMKPLSIRQLPEGVLAITWENNEQYTISLKFLRNECPCAECKGETVLLHHYEGKKEEAESPGKYELKSLEIIGTYAIQPTWGDGHGTGIYPWDYLYRLCIIAAET